MTTKWYKDYATHKDIDIRKPEEKVRQDYERTLHHDYGYDLACIDIEVRIQRGEKHRKKNLKEKADIVIYKTKEHLQRNQFKDILGIVETKRPNKKEGLYQLMSYMSASSAIWGVWTNGETIEHVYRDTESGEIKTDYIFDIPRCGESIDEIGRISKANLVPAHTHSLKPIFKRILKTLYSNTNISRREKLGSEMVRLIFTKIWDERYNQDNPPEFRVCLNEDPNTVKKRILHLFEQVREVLKEDGVFDHRETITLDSKSITWVVGQLQRYSLLKTGQDVVGDAFEVFAESKLVGEKGEFFTPREVVRTAVELVNPSPGQRILDPACGSGGFLIYAMEHIWEQMDRSPKYKNSPQLDQEKRDMARLCLYGIDKEIDLVKIAKAYMAIAGDGRSGIVQENTLHAANEFQGRAKELFTEGNEFRKFDIIFTNPPFGTKIKVLKDEAAQFDLGYSWKNIGNGCYDKTNNAKDTDPQILFTERCLQMLRNGGILAIVLPETFFHATSYRYIVDYIRNRNNIQAVIDLPHNTFRPHNNAKTCLLILQKNCPQQQNIIMAVAEEMGHDHDGNPMYRFDKNSEEPTSEIWDDLKLIRNELSDPSDPKNHYTFVVEANEIKNNIFVPRYYWEKGRDKIEETEKTISFPLQRLIDQKIVQEFSGHGSPPSEYKGKGNIPYTRVSDIVNWELYRNPTSPIPHHVYQSIKKTGVTLKPKDIIFVRRGSYRIGTVAMASPYDDELLLAKELVIMRVVKPENEHFIDAYYLLYLLSHEFTQKQIKHKTFVETTLPNIADRWKELLLPVSKNIQERRNVSRKIKSVIDAKWSALSELDKLRKKLGTITT